MSVVIAMSCWSFLALHKGPCIHLDEKRATRGSAAPQPTVRAKTALCTDIGRGFRSAEYAN